MPSVRLRHASHDLRRAGTLLCWRSSTSNDLALRGRRGGDQTGEVSSCSPVPTPQSRRAAQLPHTRRHKRACVLARGNDAGAGALRCRDRGNIGAQIHVRARTRTAGPARTRELRINPLLIAPPLVTGSTAPVRRSSCGRSLCVVRFPPPSIVHAAPTASKALRRRWRCLRHLYDPAGTTRRAASTREPEGSRHPRRADWPVARGGVKVGLTANRLRPDRPPVCRITPKFPPPRSRLAAYAQLTGMIAAGECLP